MAGLFSSKRDFITVEYCNIGEAYAKINISKGGRNFEKVLKFADYQLDNGLLVNDKLILDTIREFDTTFSTPLNLILKTEDIFTHNLFIPKMSGNAAQRLIDSDIKQNFANFQANYYVMNNNVPNDLGTVYYYYFIPSKYVEYFRVIAKKLKTVLGQVDIFSAYLAKQMNKNETDYGLVYQRGNSVSFVCMIHKKIACANDMAFTDRNDLLKKFALSIGQHEIELEQSKFSKIFLDTEDDFEFEKEFSGIEFVKIDILDNAKNLKEKEKSETNKGPKIMRNLKPLFGKKQKENGIPEAHYVEPVELKNNVSIESTPKVEVKQEMEAKTQDDPQPVLVQPVETESKEFVEEVKVQPVIETTNEVKKENKKSFLSFLKAKEPKVKKEKPVKLQKEKKVKEPKVKKEKPVKLPKEKKVKEPKKESKLIAFLKKDISKKPKEPKVKKEKPVKLPKEKKIKEPKVKKEKPVKLPKEKKKVDINDLFGTNAKNVDGVKKFDSDDLFKQNKKD